MFTTISGNDSPHFTSSMDMPRNSGRTIVTIAKILKKL